MATTTPNFGWPVPTSTDLVKDGATAIEALGDSIDASLLDLKGGTSGQVLSKNSNTDMDFTWVTSDDANAIQNTIVDAKGDLITATAADTPARLGVGTNGQILTADSTAATGIKWATPAASTSGLTLIRRSTFSGVATTGTTFDGVFTSTYKSYLMVIENISGATGTDTPQLQFRASATTTTTSYDATFWRVQLTVGTSQIDSNGAAQIAISNVIGTSANPSAGAFTLTGVGNTTNATITGTFYTGSTGTFTTGGGYRSGITFDGFLLKSSSSNISGTVAIYGLAAA